MRDAEIESATSAAAARAKKMHPLITAAGALHPLLTRLRSRTPGLLAASVLLLLLLTSLARDVENWREPRGRDADADADAGCGG